jgi:hypothetical protein
MIWPLTAVALLVVAVPVALLAGGHLSPPREAAQDLPAPTPAEKPKSDKEDEKQKDRQKKDEEKAKGKAEVKGKGAKAADPEPEPPRPVAVREVKVEVVSRLAFALGNWNDAKALASAEEVKAVAKKEGSKEVAAALEEASAKVKFDRERLVVVAFQTGGPPYGKPKYRIDQKKREVEFYCEEPRVTRRGVVNGAAVGIFVVPAGAKVKWGGLK